MKTMLLLLMALAAGTVMAQPPAGQGALKREAVINGRVNPTLAIPVKPNQIKGRHINYSGITVQLVKTDHPLQLVNPFAPEEYGSGEDNVVHSPITGKAHGLKILAIEF
jgi:hypothetical protein